MIDDALKKFSRTCAQVVTDANRISLTLFKIMIPILIVVKILQEFGIIKWLSVPLEPVMNLVGLPASMGFVWATAMLNSIFSGVVVYASLVGDTPLSVAQITVLGVMILVAHSLPVELEIARQSGPRFLFQLMTRVCSALALGILLNFIYQYGNWLQEPAVLTLKLSGDAPDLLDWAQGQIKNLGIVYFTILALVVLMRVLKWLKVLDMFARCLHPVLRLLGIGEEATSITIIALLLGIGYGGGLIIQEAKSGTIGRRDIFFALTLMGLCHSLIEDSLLFFMLGAHASGLLWARCLYALVFMFFLVRLVTKMSDTAFERYLFRSSFPQKQPKEAGTP